MAKLLTSLHGREIGLTTDRRLIVPKGLVLGDEHNQIAFADPLRQAMFNDFDGAARAYSTTVADGILSRKGSDGACVDWTVTAAPGGTVVGTIGNTTATMAVSGAMMAGGLNFKPNQGDLVFQARVKMSRITQIAVFVGFTDQVSALEMPIQSAAAADTITTNATDAVGFMFDTSMATAKWWLVGVKNDVDATLQNSTFAPVADTYETLRVVVDVSGNAYFYRNGLLVGTKLAAACTATIALVPTIAGFNRTTTGNPTLTADYWHASALRA
jgi:hypothetical protein